MNVTPSSPNPPSSPLVGEQSSRVSAKSPEPTYFQWVVDIASRAAQRITGSEHSPDLKPIPTDLAYRKLESLNNPATCEKKVIALDDFSEAQLNTLRARMPKTSFTCGWQYIGLLAPETFSGWKLHIPGENLSHSVYLYENLELVLQKWEAGGKVGGEAKDPVIPGYFIPPESSQWGKSGAVIFVPPHVFKEDKLQAFINDILSAIKEYDCKATISNEKKLCDKLYYRYELPFLCDPAVGVSHNVYHGTYRVKNADNNPDKMIESDPFVNIKTTTR